MVLNTAQWLAVAGLIGLSSCANRDPYQRTDVWRPTGANAANLAAMVADPHDLIRGRGTNRQFNKAQDIAVEHVWQDKPKPFGFGSTSGSSGSSGGGSGGSGGSGSSGAGGGTGGDSGSSSGSGS